MLFMGRCLATDKTKEHVTTLMGRTIETDPKELTPRKTPLLPSNRQRYIQTNEDVPMATVPIIMDHSRGIGSLTTFLGQRLGIAVPEVTAS
jgi:hypothetical protein